MKISRDTQQLQKTQYRGSSAENRLESEGKQGTHRVSPATENRDTNVLAYGTLERILARENMLQAYARVVSNKGSHGVDKMEVYELKQFLQSN